MTFDPSEIIGLLTLGIHDAGVYFSEHARVRHTAATLASRFDDLPEGRENSVFLGVVEGRLVHDGKLLLGSTLIAKRLIDAAVRFRSGGFLFRRGVSAAELTAFFSACASSRALSDSLEEARRMLKAAGVHHVEISAPHGTQAWLGGGGRSEEPGSAASKNDAVAAEVVRSLGGAIPAFQRLRQAVETSHSSAEGGRDVDVSSSRATVEHLIGAMSERTADVLHLARYPDHASYTVGHSVRVALLALAVGRHIGFEEHLLIEIGTAGLLHDVGKSRIPHSVLFKRGRLDDEERKVISTHAQVGAGILLDAHDAPPLGIAAAFGHHLRHDRSGYPKLAPWGAAGRVTALIQVCDVFEALTAVRPYKPSLPPRRAYEIMLADIGAFDPSAFAAFVSAMGFFPPGSRVRLTSGEEALVLRVGRNPALPIIELTRDARGDEIPAAKRPLVNLASQHGGEPRAIDEVILDDLATSSAPAQDEAAAADPAAPLPKPPACCHDESAALH